ncbi:hypothetical protein BGX33_001479 [Mortierella sp. NVP41]|nr:hypothetical protein BGX33_001479 [Mortierella sp. NVP41]
MSDDDGAVSELSKTLGVFLRGQSDRLRKLTLGRDILCCENEASHAQVKRSIPRSVEVLEFHQWEGSHNSRELHQIRMHTWEPEPVSKDAIKEFQRRHEMRRATAT